MLIFKMDCIKTNRFAKAHTGINIYEDFESTFKDFKISGKYNENNFCIILIMFILSR